MKTKVKVFWDATYDRVLKSCLSFGGGHRHRIQRLTLFSDWQTLRLEAVRFSETSRIILTPGKSLIFLCIDGRIPKLAAMTPLTSHLPDVFQWYRDNALVAFLSFTSYRNDSPRSVHSPNKTVFPPAALLTDKHGARCNMLHKIYRVGQWLMQLECRNLNLLSEMQTNRMIRSGLLLCAHTPSYIQKL